MDYALIEVSQPERLSTVLIQVLNKWMPLFKYQSKGDIDTK